VASLWDLGRLVRLSDTLLAVTGATDVPALDRDEIERHLDAICAIGNRYVGTAGEAAARAYVLRHFAGAGLRDIRAEEFEVRTYGCDQAACHVPAWGLSLECVGLQGTISGEIEAEAVYLGGGESVAELLGDAPEQPPLEGRIAVIQSFWPWELTDVLLERGIAGLVLISDVPENLIAHLPARWYGSLDAAIGQGPAAVPGETVGARTGRRLVRALASGASAVRISHAASYATRTTSNLLAATAGTDQNGVVLAAHYDTFMDGAGAHDNASGLAALLAAASAWSASPPLHRVVLASFAAEELGLCGSAEYCRRHAEELPSLAAMVNLDALAWRVAGPRCLVVDPGLERFATALLEHIGWAPDAVWDAREAESDIAPFVAAGVPGAWCWRFPPQHPYFGSARDSRELLDVDLITETANAAACLAYRIACEASPAFRRLGTR